MKQNNKYILSKMAIVIMTVAILITGCKKNNNNEVIEKETTTEETVINTVNESDFIVEEYTGADFEKIYMDKDITAFRALSLDEFIEMMEHYFPLDDPDRSYKTVLKISEDTEMTKDVWENVRDIVCKQLFGEPFDPNTEVTTSDDSVYQDEDWIYIVPNADYIESLSTDEFIEWLFKLDEYNGYDYVDYNTIPKEDIPMYQKTIVEELRALENNNE